MTAKKAPPPPAGKKPAASSIPGAPADGMANPELTAEPGRIPPGPIMEPHIPAPVAPGLPPGSPSPSSPVEAPPAQQGSLTPAQAEQMRKTNPAIKEAKVGASQDNAIITEEQQLNEDGHIAGEEVSQAQHQQYLIKQQELNRKQLEEDAKERGKKK